MTNKEDLQQRADAWATLMEKRGERVAGPRLLRVHGEDVKALRSFTDVLGNVTVFAETGIVIEYAHGELTQLLPLDVESLWTAGVGLMKDAARWPLGRVLGLVHTSRMSHEGLPEVAFLVRDRGSLLFFGNVDDLGPGPLARQIAPLATLSYVSFEALAADGWRIDKPE